MSFDRDTAGSVTGAQPTPTSGPPAGTGTSGAPTGTWLQILSNEHSGLLAARSLAWNEAFARAGMFLSTLSGAIIAIALVAQASAFGDLFAWFALLILPVVLFIGIGTFIRQGGSNAHDALCVTGMNRIRAAYVELAPGVDRYFVTSWHDDPRGVSVSMGSTSSGRPGVAEIVAGTPTMVAILNAVLAGVILGLVARQIGAATGVAVLAGVVGFVVATSIQFWYAGREIMRLIGGQQAMFPGPDED